MRHYEVKPLANLSKREESSALYDAALRGDDDEVLRLLESGISPNAVNSDGRSAMYAAASRGRHEMLELLCSRGADPDHGHAKSATTPLHVAVASGRLQCAVTLIDVLECRSLNLRGGYSNITPTKLARECANHAQMVAALEKRGGLDEQPKVNPTGR